MNWRRTILELPPNGTLCECITPYGVPTNLIYDSNLWWTPDRKMYVYYEPLYWRPITINTGSIDTGLQSGASPSPKPETVSTVSANQL